MFFTLSENEELFTTYDYKRLLTEVETHFRLQVLAHELRPVTVCAFFNPEQGRGCVTFDTIETNPTVIVSDLDFANGNDILTVFFDTD